MEPSRREICENSTEEASFQSPFLCESPRSNEIEDSSIEEGNYEDKVHSGSSLLRKRVHFREGHQFDEDGSEDKASEDDQKGSGVGDEGAKTCRPSLLNELVADFHLKVLPIAALDHKHIVALLVSAEASQGTLS